MWYGCEDNPDTDPISISIITPSDSSTVEGKIEIAIVTNADDQIEYVEFIVDSTVVHVDSSYEWLFVWDTEEIADDRWHKLSARVIGRNEEIYHSNEISVFLVKQVPLVIVNIISPSNESTREGMIEISVETNNDAIVETVDFLIDGSLVFTDDSPGWSCSWDSEPYADGAWHGIVARATDTEGVQYLSDEVRVMIPDPFGNLPIRITNPREGDIVEGDVLIRIEAKQGYIHSTSITINRIPFGWQDVDPPFQYIWHTDSLPIGMEYNIRATADYKTSPHGPMRTASHEITVITPGHNEPPVADFSITPAYGSPETVFTFDASNCSDPEDDVNDLQVRWRFYSGGWSTDYSFEKIKIFEYIITGYHFVELQVLDTDGKTTNLTKYLTNGVIEGNGLTDIDGNTYPSVIIGDQEWMAENLRVTHFRNGDPIPNDESADWWGLTTPTFGSFSPDSVPSEIFGLYYNWHASGDDRNLAPEGWHIPTEAELYALRSYIAVVMVGPHVGTALRSESGWSGYGYGNGWDVFHFKAVPAGYRYSTSYFGWGAGTNFWSSTEVDSVRSIIGSLWEDFNVGPSWKNNGYSVRCIKD